MKNTASPKHLNYRSLVNLSIPKNSVGHSFCKVVSATGVSGYFYQPIRGQCYFYWPITGKENVNHNAIAISDISACSLQ